MNGPLWYSGPGMIIVASGSAPSSVACASRRSVHTEGSPDTMSFGRPVDPPEVGAFHAVATASGNGRASASAGGRQPTGRLGVPARS